MLNLHYSHKNTLLILCDIFYCLVFKEVWLCTAALQKLALWMNIFRNSLQEGSRLGHREWFEKGGIGNCDLHPLGGTNKPSIDNSWLRTINTSRLMSTFTGSIKSSRLVASYRIDNSLHLRSSCSPRIPSTITNFATYFISSRIYAESGGIMLIFPNLKSIYSIFTPFLVISLQ